MRVFLVLAALLLVATVSLAQIRPNEKIPTEITLYVEKSSTTMNLDGRATLIALDLTGKTAVPLEGQTVFFQECAVGEFASGCPSGAHRCGLIPQDYWRCESGCCMGHVSKLTDMEGKAGTTFEGANDSTIVAVYPGSSVYLPSNSTATYVYPPLYGQLQMSASFTLVLVVGFVLVIFLALFFRNRFR